MSLQLTRLRVEQLRQFREPYELGDLKPGLNIFTGPNEAGKSTLVRAIRAAFFERYRSKVVEDLRPRTDSSAMPSIDIDFLLDSEPGQLHKSFLGSRARCNLTLGSQTWDGTDAEDHLAGLLGFGYAGKGASKAEHCGIPGLLWVEQGTGQELAEAALHARDHIHTALQDLISDASAGSLAASGGDELLARFQAERDELLTGTGRSRGPLQQAEVQVQELQDRLVEIEERITAYQQRVDQIARLRTQHAQDEQERPWDLLREQLTAAKQKEQALAQNAQQLADASAALQRLQSQRALLVEQVQNQDRLTQRLEQSHQQCSQAELALQQANEAAAFAQQQASKTRLAAEVARGAFALARQEATRAEHQARRKAAEEDRNRIQLALKAALASQEQLEQLQARAAACALTDADMKALRQLERRWQDLVLQRKAISTRLQFCLDEGQQLTLREAGASRSLQGAGEHLFTEPVTLTLPGLGELIVTPGGEDLAGLASDCEVAHAAFQQRLQALGLVDVAQAEARFQQHQALQTDLKHAQLALQQAAPEGLTPLRARLAQVEGLIQSSQAALDALPAASGEPVPDLGAADLAQQAADTLDRQAHDDLADARQRQARAEVDHQSRVRELRLLTDEMGDPQRIARHAEFQRQLVQLGQDLTLQDSVVAQCRRLRDEARPEIVQQDIDRLSRSITQLERAHSERHTEIQVLDHALQQAGAAGLDEGRQQVAGELARAQRRLQELQQRAQALSLLCTKLQSRRQAAMAQLRAPLQRHLQRYLQLLFPHAEIEVGEDLTPDVLTRRPGTGVTDAATVSSLSFGAREQLGLISRFAYADLLRDAGRPTLLILDDALVHSDTERLTHMKRVLFDAAQRHQVLFFTCHPDNWRDMGVSCRVVAGG